MSKLRQRKKVSVKESRQEAETVRKQQVTCQERELIIATMLFLISIPVRFQHLGFPSRIVFDEVHFGKYITEYMTRSFFFDIHPPLAKLLLALVAWMSGYKGDFDVDEVGSVYTEQIPFVAMRTTSALMGALVVPLAYTTMRDAGHSHIAAIIVALAACFENGWITNHRFILLDSYLLLSVAFAVFAWIRFSKQQAFHQSWWIWLLWTGVGLGCAISVKWIGFFTVGLIGMCALKQLWEILGDLQVSKSQYVAHFTSRMLCLMGVPLAIYMTTFYVHFAILNKSGTGDHLMQFETQNELKGIEPVDAPLAITYGSLITMRHLKTMGGYLHSHLANYPEGSLQQQVTLYPFKDDNNWWRILKANESKPVIQDVLANDNQTWLEYVRHGDTIRLEHVKTVPRKLHSHDFAAPITDTDYHKEVSAYGYPGFEGDSNDYWQVQIEANTKYSNAGKQLEPRRSHFRLLHTNQNCHLYSNFHRLPEWGFHQQEVSCISEGLKDTAMWMVIDTQNSLLPFNTTMLPEHRPNFLEKFVHINKAMWTVHRELEKEEEKEEDADQSKPYAWPFLLAGRHLFIDETYQIILLGNPVVYWSSAVAVMTLLIFFGVIQLREKRGYRGMRAFDETYASFFVLGWAMHYLPFLRMGRPLSLHHYMSALYFAMLALGVCLDFLLKRMPRVVQAAVCVLFVLTIIYYYCLFYPITYGDTWTVEECQNASLLKSWDLNCNRYIAFDAEEEPIEEEIAHVDPVSLAAPTILTNIIEEQPLDSLMFEEKDYAFSNEDSDDEEEDDEEDDHEEEEEDEDENEDNQIRDEPTEAPDISEPEPEFIDGKEVFPEEDEDEDDYWPKTTYGLDPENWLNPEPFKTRDIPVTIH